MWESIQVVNVGEIMTKAMEPMFVALQRIMAIMESAFIALRDTFTKFEQLCELIQIEADIRESWWPSSGGG